MSFYYLGRYESACQVYETLVRHHQSSVYRLYHAQSLYKAGDLVEAGRVLEAVSEYTEQVEQLKIAILYAMDQTQECRSMLRASTSKAHANVQNEGCMLYKEGKYRCQLGHALLVGPLVTVTGACHMMLLPHLKVDIPVCINSAS
jgi:tetratricopeptide repeat protein 30